MSSKSIRRMSSRSSKSFLDNSSYSPNTPLFDTCSSEDSDYNDSSLSPKHGRGRRGKYSRTESKPRRSNTRKRYVEYSESSDAEKSLPPPKRGRSGHRKHYSEPSSGKDNTETRTTSLSRSNSKDKANSPEEKKYDEYLNAPCRIVSGRYAGLTGRIKHVVASGWVYIAEGGIVKKPVRWKDVVILNESEKSTNIHESKNLGIRGEPDEKVFAEKVQTRYDLKEEQSTEYETQRLQCKVKGCTKEKHSNCGNYCKNHYKKLVLEGDDIEPDLVGAKIRLTHPSHAGVKANIIEKCSGIYLKVKWNSTDGKSPPKILPLQDISDISFSNSNASSIDIKNRYSGARVEKDGVSGKVKKAILSEWYITDIVNGEKGFKRSDFVVLKYACGIVPDGNLKNDDVEEVAGSDQNEINQNSEADEYSAESERVEESNPLVGATALITKGKHEGHTGKVMSIRSRGWLDIEGIENKVKYSSINIVDDGAIDLSLIEDYLRDTGVLKKMPHVVKLNDIMTIENDELDSADVASRRSSARINNNVVAVDKREQTSPALTDNMHRNKEFEYKIHSTNFCSLGTKIEDEPRVKWGRKNNLSLAIPNIPLMKTHSARHRFRTRGLQLPIFGHILAQPVSDFCDGDISAKAQSQDALKVVPENLRHLPLDTPIEIFNRRTGKIMRGNEAIALSELSVALMNHSEYEPIVPSLSNSK